ncbi:hypothetical protein ACLOJK_037539 [Asimina triloba]
MRSRGGRHRRGSSPSKVGRSLGNVKILFRVSHYRSASSVSIKVAKLIFLSSVQPKCLKAFCIATIHLSAISLDPLENLEDSTCGRQLHLFYIVLHLAVQDDDALEEVIETTI